MATTELEESFNNRAAKAIFSLIMNWLIAIYFFTGCKNMVVNYKGALMQALLDMADWLQSDQKPLGTTKYHMENNQVIEEEDASKREGMQAAVSLTVNGKKCVHVKAGEEFILKAEMIVPANAGEITSVCYDFEDNWDYPMTTKQLFPVKGEFTRTADDGIHGAVSEITYAYQKPGIYFASVRITSQRDGDEEEIFTQVMNLDRVRIIVE